MPRQYDLERLERDLDEEQTRVPRKALDAVTAEANVVRDNWRTYMRARSKHGHIPYLPGAITHSVTPGGTGPEAEVGPDKTLTQGPLGNLLEFGSRNNRPHEDGYRAVREREVPFEARVDQIARGFL